MADNDNPQLALGGLGEIIRRPGPLPSPLRILGLLERLTRGYPLVPWKPLLRAAALSRGLARGYSVVASCLLVAKTRESAR
jgi:hypothetical protein